MEKPNSTRKSSGKRKAAPENSKKSFILKGKCRLLTIGEYIELICEDNLSILIVEGKPDAEALNEAKMDVISEFSELSGDEGSSAIVDSLRKIYKYRAEIMGMTIALKNIYARFEEAVAVLRRFGIRGDVSNDPESIGKFIKRVQAEMKSRSTRMQTEINSYNSLSTKNESKPLAAQNVFDEMSIISQFVKYGIDTGTNLALYASHRKNYKSYSNSLKNPKHGNDKKH